MRRLLILLSLLAISCAAHAQQPVQVTSINDVAAQVTAISGTANVNTASYALAGHCGVAVTLVNTTFTATMGFQVSLDNASSFSNTGVTYYRKSGSAQPTVQANVAYSANSNTDRYTILPPGGATHVKVNFTALGSNTGTSSVTVVGTDICDRTLYSSVGTTGQTVPPDAVYVGGNGAGNLVGLNLDSSGDLNVIFPNVPGIDVHSFGGAVVATGTGTGGSGIPRVTVSNDSTVGVVGGAAVGAAISGNPVPVAGQDSSGVSVPTICDKSAQGTAAAAANTQMVALAASKKIYVCSLIIQGTGAAGTAKVVYGTGTACATGLTNLTPAWTTAIGTFLPAFGTQGSFPIMSTASANALCIVMATASATSNWFVNYAQF